MRHICPPKGFLSYFKIVHRVIDAVVPTLQVASSGAFCAGAGDAIENGGSLYNGLMMGAGGLGFAVLTFVNTRLGSDLQQYVPYQHEKKSEWVSKELVKIGAGWQLAGNIMALSQGNYFYGIDAALGLLSAYFFAGYAHKIELIDRWSKLRANQDFISESMLCWRQENFKGLEAPRRALALLSWLSDRMAELTLILFSFPIVQDAFDLELWMGILIAAVAFGYASRKFFLYPRCYSDMQLLGDFAHNPAQLKYQMVFFRRLSLFTVVYAPTTLIIHSAWGGNSDNAVLMSDLGDLLKSLAVFGLLMAHELGVLPQRPSLQLNASAINWNGAGSFGPPPSSSYGSTGSRDQGPGYLLVDQSDGVYPGMHGSGRVSAASSFLFGREISDVLGDDLDHKVGHDQFKPSAQVVVEVVVTPSAASLPLAQMGRGLGKAASEGRLAWQPSDSFRGQADRVDPADGVNRTAKVEEKQIAGLRGLSVTAG